jgi:hypothetical protein
MNPLFQRRKLAASSIQRPAHCIEQCTGEALHLPSTCACILTRSCQPPSSTGAVGPRSHALHALSVSKSYSTHTINASRVARDNVSNLAPISRTKTLPPDPQSLPIVLVSPEDVQPVPTSRKRGDGSSNRLEVLDPRHSHMEDRDHSLKLLAGSSLVPSPSLPPGTSSQSSLSPVSSAALKRTSSEMRSIKGTPSGERSGTLESVPKPIAHSDANKGIRSASRYGRSHPNLPDAMHERVTEAELPSSSAPITPHEVFVCRRHCPSRSFKSSGRCHCTNSFHTSARIWHQ